MSGASASELINGVYAVDLSRPLPGAGGGLPAFAATDRTAAQRPLMAVQVRPDAPARAAALTGLANLSEAGVLAPLAYGPAPSGDGRLAGFVICPAPAGPAVWADPAARAQPPWDEAALIERVLRPAAAGLAALVRRGVTHRAVRPNNLFLPAAASAAMGGGVTLGCAWASPPGLLQPGVFEPPYLAMCAPAARGDGHGADDVYALGVVLLTLALGRVPLAELGEEAVIERKLEMGCFAALTTGERLPALLGDLLSGMLADDPQHRPEPMLLADPKAARSRRVAKRQVQRAGQALLVEGLQVWNARMLAYAVMRQPAAALRMLRLGVVDHWLRRVLGDLTLAARLEDTPRPTEQRGPPTGQAGRATAPAAAPLSGGDPMGGGPDAAGLVRVVATLDPLAPMFWNGLLLWPDAIGSLLAAAGERAAAIRGEITRLVADEAVSAWASLRGEQHDMAMWRAQARSMRMLLREPGWCGGMPRLTYGLNALLACRSPLLGGFAVARLADLLPALDAAAEPAGKRGLPPFDQDLVAFLAARLPRGNTDLSSLSPETPVDTGALVMLRTLAAQQVEQAAGPLPRLAAWLAACAAPQLETWRNRRRRGEKQAMIAEVAAAGDLPRLLSVFDSPAERKADEAEYLAAVAAVQQIDAEVAGLARATAHRKQAARRLGQEIAAALALAAFAVCAVAAALS